MKLLCWLLGHRPRLVPERLPIRDFHMTPVIDEAWAATPPTIYPPRGEGDAVVIIYRNSCRRCGDTIPTEER